MGNSPWRWSAGLTAASCSQCRENTHGAKACLGRSHHLLWWPRDRQNTGKLQYSLRNVCICKNISSFEALQSWFCPKIQERMSWGNTKTQKMKPIPSYTHSTGMQTAFQSRVHRSNWCLWGWTTWFLLAAGSGGTGNRSHASCSPCIPFFGNLAQEERSAKPAYGPSLTESHHAKNSAFHLQGGVCPLDKSSAFF